MPYSFGDLVLVRFPFTNQTGFKQRPAVVVSSVRYNSCRPDVVLMAVTSQTASALSVDDVLIAHWSSAGLIKPSAVKPVFFTIEQQLIRKQLGSMAATDQASIRNKISKLLR